MNLQYINSLIETNRYNPEILPQLETFVQAQIDAKAYHLEANLAVLKLYQFHPERTQKNIIAKILLKALMNLPNPDFSLCLYLIPERLHGEEPVRTLSTLAALLETARFVEFWMQATAGREEVINSVMPSTAGFDEAIRTFIGNVVTLTYHTIPKDQLAEMLNFKSNSPDFESFIAARGWTRTADTVSFPKVEEGFSNAKKMENFKFEDLSRILSVSLP